ncbi:hypothetical protein AB0E85_32705 [Streptomyces sp. NPDC029044]|uniref:hypothetical protein n=1 Tax=Streptomyces sp. NPDC029044 TaxID=3157198 RepID=UPI0033E81337
MTRTADATAAAEAMSAADTTFVAPCHEEDTLVARAEKRVRHARGGVHGVTVRRGDEMMAEFRGRSRGVGSTRPEESA